MASLDSTPSTGFGKALRYYRRRKRLSQTQLGELIGVDQTTISDWENRAEPTRDFFVHADNVAGVLGVAAGLIEHGEIERPINIGDAYGEDWDVRDIRTYAPNTPIEEAKEVLEDWENLDAAGKKAVKALLAGLRQARKQASKNLEG